MHIAYLFIYLHWTFWPKTRQIAIQDTMFYQNFHILEDTTYLYNACEVSVMFRGVCYIFIFSYLIA